MSADARAGSAPARGRGIYREESLEKLASPERLDQLVRIVKPHGWLTLTGVAAGLVVALCWSVLGHVPSTAHGTAVLVRPKQVVSFHAAADGRIDSIEVSAGDHVEQGDLLARIRLPVLETQLQQARIELSEFQRRSSRMTSVDSELARQELAFLAVQRDLVQERMDTVRESAERYERTSTEHIAEQRRALETSRERALELGAALQERYAALKGLWEEKRLAVEPVLEMRTRVIENELRLAELDVEAQKIDVAEAQAVEAYEAQLDLVRELQIQLNDLELREMAVSRRLVEEELQNDDVEAEIIRRLEELESRLESDTRIVFTGEHPGRVLEIAINVGQHVEVGDRLGKMEIEDPEAGDLMVLAYFSVADGKKIESGMPIRFSPATAERDRWGSIRGSVVRASDYPVTTSAAANQIGDLELASRLLGAETRIEVLATLERDDDSPSGLAWTSGAGPSGIPITAGTTGDARVTVEERRPITVVLPFLRSVTGM